MYPRLTAMQYIGSYQIIKKDSRSFVSTRTFPSTSLTLFHIFLLFDRKIWSCKWV